MLIFQHDYVLKKICIIRSICLIRILVAYVDINFI